MIFFGKDVFIPYMKDKDFAAKLKKLKESFNDTISLEYINKFIENSKSWNKYIYDEEKVWTNYDKQLFKEFAELEFVQPFPDLIAINSFMFHSWYGLKDLPSAVLDTIDGRTIIDAGAYKREILFMFFILNSAIPQFIFMSR